MSKYICYKNPVIRGFYPDPSICRVDKDYYLVTSSFEYLPGVPLFHSHNLIDWQQIGHCIQKEHNIDLTNTPCSGGIFAPTIRYHKGVFYMITTNISQGNFVMKSNDIIKGFGDPTWIDIKGIDPSLYFEDDKVYVQYASFEESGNCIKQTEIDIETGELLKEPVIISYGCGGRDVEAPHIYFINGWYYLMCAEGGTREGHMVSIQRSQNIYGPYETSPYHPVVSNKDYSKQKLQSVGHADLIEDHEGHWWIVALATRPYKHRHLLGRETILLPIEWKAGWPIVTSQYAKEEIECIGISPAQQSTESFHDNFQSSQLSLHYNTIRDFITDNYKIENNSLILYGNGEYLDTSYTPIFIGVRQKEYRCHFETKINASINNNSRAGLSILMDKDHHMEIGISNHQLYVKKKVADIETINTYKDNINDLIIGIEADQQFYYFYYIDNNEKFIIDKTYIKHLCTETVFSAFTGVYCGMFIEGLGEAQFYYFDYQEA
ncbi:MAG: family 43 glycosylhydrolase [Coprobacillus sp.]